MTYEEAASIADSTIKARIYGPIFRQTTDLLSSPILKYTRSVLEFAVDDDAISNAVGQSIHLAHYNLEIFCRELPSCDNLSYVHVFDHSKEIIGEAVYNTFHDVRFFFRYKSR